MEKTNFNRKAKESPKIKDRIETWVAEKGFMAQGTNIEDLARSLGINRTYVSNYINDTYCLNFNTWINSLRTAEAQKIMKDNPNISIGQVAIMTGYADITHFSKQFKLHTGINPSKWKRNNA